MRVSKNQQNCRHTQQIYMSKPFLGVCMYVCMYVCMHGKVESDDGPSRANGNGVYLILLFRHS